MAQSKLRKLFTFTGNITPDAAPRWIDAVNEHCKLHNLTTDEAKLDVVWAHVGGEAKEWLESLPKVLSKDWEKLDYLFDSWWVKGYDEEMFAELCEDLEEAPYGIFSVNLLEETEAERRLDHELQAAGGAEKAFAVACSALGLKGAEDTRISLLRAIWTFAIGQGGEAGKREGIQLGIEQEKKRAVVEKEESKWKGSSSPKVPKKTYSSVAIATSPSPPTTSLSVQTETIEDSGPLKWSDDAESLPIHSSSAPAIRNLDSLSSGNAKPFATLQTRSRRCHQKSGKSKSITNSKPTSTSTTPVITRKHPNGIGKGKPCEVFNVQDIPFGSHPSGQRRRREGEWYSRSVLSELGRMLVQLGRSHRFELFS
jgi:hypothetical protein